ncbi:MAG: M48 family metallopeptidase [bacterium]
MDFEVIKSNKRRKTVYAKIIEGKLYIYLPEGLCEHEEKKWVDKMLMWAEDQKKKRELNDSTNLEKLSEKLNREYLGGRAKWASIEYVSNQKRIFGSCSVKSGEIRISDKLAKMPDWVRDYVVLHELAHLIYPDHSKPFWRLVNQYRLTERARGYLMAVHLEQDEAK